MSDWLPIESAPKDTRVIVWVPLLSMLAELPPLPSEMYEGLEGKGEAFFARLNSTDGFWRDYCAPLRGTPTHWQPAPNNPNT